MERVAGEMISPGMRSLDKSPDREFPRTSTVLLMGNSRAAGHILQSTFSTTKPDKADKETVLSLLREFAGVGSGE